MQTHYEIYIHKFEDAIIEQSIEVGINCLASEFDIDADKIQYALKDVSDLDYKELKKMINCTITDLRLQNLSEDDYFISSFVYKISENDYVIVFAIRTNGKFLIDDVVISVFGEKEILKYTETANVKDRYYSSINYWETVLPKTPPKLKVFGVSGNATETAWFKLDDSVYSMIERYFKKSSTSMQAVFAYIWGRIFSSFFDSQDILMDMVNSEGAMPRVPIYYKKMNNMKKECASVVSQFLQKNSYDSISYDDLEKALGYSLRKKTLCSFCFIGEETFDTILNDLKEGVLYRIPALVDTKSPINISYNFVGEKKSITYLYSTHIFSKVRMSSVHEMFCHILETYLSGKVEKEDIVVKEEVSIDKIKDEKLQAKAKVLKMCEMFYEYEDSVIKEIATMSDVIFKNYQQTIISEGTNVDRIYIIADGKIEVCAKDLDNYINPLQILSQGNVFGLESLGKTKKSKVNYVVNSDSMIAFSIKASDFYKLCNKDNTLFEKVMDVQTNRLYKFQKLWLING